MGSPSAVEAQQPQYSEEQHGESRFGWALRWLLVAMHGILAILLVISLVATGAPAIAKYASHPVPLMWTLAGMVGMAGPALVSLVFVARKLASNHMHQWRYFFGEIAVLTLYYSLAIHWAFHVAPQTPPEGTPIELR